MIFSTFAWGYAMFQVPGGWLGDKYGPRSVLAMIVTYWSIMTAATAQCIGMLSFSVVRFLFGVGEAGAFPTATRAMQMWYTSRSEESPKGSHTRKPSGSCYRSSNSRSHHFCYGAGGGVLRFRCCWRPLVCALHVMYRNMPEEA